MRLRVQRQSLGSTGASPVVYGAAPKTRAQKTGGVTPIRVMHERVSQLHARAAEEPSSLRFHFCFARALGEAPNATGQAPVLPGTIGSPIRVGEPNAPAEREANRIANQALGEPARVERHASDMSSQMEKAPGSVPQLLAEPGRPLDAPVKREMEQYFGYDFSRVRVHSGGSAQMSARELDARAYTVGHHIVFNTGEFAPRSHEGRRLLTHELTHVVQQPSLTTSSVLRRQGSKSSAPAVLKLYDRSNFSDRFDGEVDVGNHRVTLIMRLAINDASGADKPEVQVARISTFFVAAKAAIEKAWVGAGYVLKSPCRADRYAVRVRLSLDYKDPHQTITLWRDAGERSSSTNWQSSDTQEKTRTSPVLIDEKKEPSKSNVQERTFTQVPVVHEFGHLMGLEHPLCPRNDPRCYGVTLAQKDDLMGYGSTISKRDYAPFIRIMERYGRDSLSKECNTWEPVA